jgi:prepilin-type N-terminal cleavage/methylation domain-containing protein
MTHRLRHNPRKTARRGFTLIEALIAMTLMAIILPIAMQGISIALSLSSDARRKSEAATLARMKLDELVVTTQWNGGQLRGNFGDSWQDYEWEATTNSWNIDGQMTELIVEVSWPWRNSRRSVAMSTLVSEATQ